MTPGAAKIDFVAVFLEGELLAVVEEKSVNGHWFEAR